MHSRHFHGDRFALGLAKEWHARFWIMLAASVEMLTTLRILTNNYMFHSDGKKCITPHCQFCC